MAVEGVSYLIDENNSNLLLNAVPSAFKNKVRIAIDSFFEPLGMLISSLIFLLWNVNNIALGLALALGALVVALCLRAQYRNAVLVNLSRNALHFERKTGDWIKFMSKKQRRSAEFQLIAILRQRDESAQLLAFEALLQFRQSRILPRLLNHLQSLSFRGKLRAIELLSDSAYALDGQVLDRLSHLMRETSHPALKSGIHFYFAKYGLLSPEKISADLKSHDVTLKAAAILSLKKSVELPAPTQEAPHAVGWIEWAERLQKSWTAQPPAFIAFLRLQAAAQLQQLLHSNLDEEVCTGLQVLGIEGSVENVDSIFRFLSHPSTRVKRTAAEALSKVIDPTCARHGFALVELLTRFSDSAYRISLLHAIGRMRDSSLVRQLLLSSIHFRPSERRKVEEVVCHMGLRSVPTLLAMTKDAKLHDRCRVLSGRILGRVALPQLRANLFDIISVEINRAYFYFYHSFDVERQWEPFPMLKDALTTGFHSAIDFIIQLLGVAGSIERSEVLAHALRSKNPKVRGNAVETLEKTCEAKIFHRLKPLIDERPIEEKLRLYLKENRPVHTFEELLDVLDASASSVNHVIALTLKARHNVPNWRTSLRKHMEKDEELFHHFAYELLEV